LDLFEGDLGEEFIVVSQELSLWIIFIEAGIEVSQGLFL
jgi:hypothetical protein